MEGTAPVPATPPAPATAPEPEIALTWAEILEVQKRLGTLGMNPGPVDGIVGPLTTRGAQRYEELRGGPVSGRVDRRLLRLLQQDAAPPVVSLEARAH
jgi:peptidoglycan hydrolase-like protein with peptidoglycan-binding domain